MSSYVLTRRANLDVQQIWNYIAEDNIDVADRVIREVRLAMEGLNEMPGKGHRRLDVRNSRYRFWAVYSYIIAYFPDTKPLQIVRVIHGRRNFRQVLA